MRRLASDGHSTLQPDRTKSTGSSRIPPIPTSVRKVFGENRGGQNDGGWTLSNIVPESTRGHYRQNSFVERVKCKDSVAFSREVDVAIRARNVALARNDFAAALARVFETAPNQEVCRIHAVHGVLEFRIRGSHIAMQMKDLNGTLTVPVPDHRELRTAKAAVYRSPVRRAAFRVRGKAIVTDAKSDRAEGVR